MYRFSYSLFSKAAVKHPELSSEAVLVCSNLSVALCRTKDFGEAIDAANTCLDIDINFAKVCTCIYAVRVQYMHDAWCIYTCVHVSIPYTSVGCTYPYTCPYCNCCVCTFGIKIVTLKFMVCVHM